MVILFSVVHYFLVGSGMMNLPEFHQINNFSADDGSYSSQAADNNYDELSSTGQEILSPPQVQEKVVSMTAYTSRKKETDSTPCISADGTNICKYDGCVVASNDYPFDTVVVIEGFGECVVKDRMSSRYTGTDNMDLYFGRDLEGALEFGRQNLKIKISS